MGVSLPRLLWRPSPNRSSRRGQRVRLAVVHATMGSYAGAVSWLRNSRAEASAHDVLREDGAEATQLVRRSEKAWACAAYNAVSVNLELAGSGPAWPLEELWRGARIVAFYLHENGLPARYARLGIGRGFCRHKDLGALGGGHVDPIMPPSLWRAFCLMVKAEAARGGLRAEWGR